MGFGTDILNKACLLFALGGFGCAIAGSPDDSQLPAIEVWYGDQQHFGRLGNPQRLINILGSVSASERVARLTYSLNGGAEKSLSMGCDTRRLARRGDFNIELDRRRLRRGENKVVITAVGDQQTVSRTVNVDYTPGRKWPLPYTIDWSKVQRIHDVAEVVDGLWKLEAGGVRTVEPYYDRVLAIGDMSWTDYEVTVPVTYHKMLAEERVASAPYSTQAHASLLLRWQGHDDDGKRPRVKWYPMGALAMLQANVKWEGNRWIIHGGESGRLVTEPGTRRIEPNRPYVYKMRIETLPGPKSRYSVKVWPADVAEPPGWDLTAVDSAEDFQSGSLLLVVHHAEVTFGNVRVVPLG